MPKHFSITTGDPLDTTTTFTAYIFIINVSIFPVNDSCEVLLGFYRSTNSNKPGGALVGQPISIVGTDTATTDTDGNTISVLYSSWLDGNGNINFENIYSNLQTLSVIWPSTGEVIDLTTATTLP